MKLRHHHAWWVSALAAGLVRAIGWTCRVRVRGQVPTYREQVFSMWHGDMLLTAHRHRNRGAVVLVSNNRDGEIIARTVERLGYRTVRGSSTRGGVAALRRFLALQDGNGWVVTPDGPRGPRHSVKDGVLHLASLTGWPVLPVGVAVSRAWTTGSWDRMQIPKPFSRMVHHFGEQMTLPPDLTAEQRRGLAEELKEHMATAQAAAEHALADWTGKAPSQLPTDPADPQRSTSSKEPEAS